jgi:hypothetical protein
MREASGKALRAQEGAAPAQREAVHVARVERLGRRVALVQHKRERAFVFRVAHAHTLR